MPFVFPLTLARHKKGELAFPRGGTKTFYMLFAEAVNKAQHQCGGVPVDFVETSSATDPLATNGRDRGRWTISDK